MADFREMFPNRLRAARRAKKWSQAHLADLMNTHGVIVSKYELGQAVPKLDTAYRLANVLGVKVDWLCGEGSLEEGIR